MNNEMSIDVNVTLEDHVQFNEYILDQPSMRRKRLIRWVLVILLSPILGLVLGLLTGWITSNDPPDTLTNLIAQMRLGDFAPPSLVVSGFLLAVALLLRLFRSYLLRRALRRLLKEREGIDPVDPQLRERVHCTFDDRGFYSKGAATQTTIDWAQVRSLDETRDLLVVRTGTLSSFLLPKRDISQEQAAAIVAIANAHKTGRGRLLAPLTPGWLGG